MIFERLPDGQIRARCEFGESTLMMVARDVRKDDRTGAVHAWVGLKLDNKIRHSVINVDDDEKRLRLANSLVKALPVDREKSLRGTNGTLLSVLVKEAFDDFSHDLWQEWAGAMPIVHLGGTEQDERVSYIQNPYIIAEAGTILYSAPGMGKSATALGLAMTIHHGIHESAWGIVPKARKVLFVNLERSERSIQRRITRMNLALGLPRGASLPFLNARGRTLDDVLPRIRKAIEEEHYEVIIIDSISRMGLGSMNKDDVANSGMDRLNGLGVTWFAIAHSAKSADDSHHSIFGSMAFEAAADLTLYLRSEKDGDDLLIAIEGDKGNDVPKPSTRYLRYSFDPEFGITEVTRIQAGEAPALEARIMTIAEKIAAFLSTGPATRAEIAEALDIADGSIGGVLSNKDRFVAIPGKRPLRYANATREPFVATNKPANKTQAEQAVFESETAFVDAINGANKTTEPCVRCARSSDAFTAEGEPICSACADDD